ncbi:MAG: hypothetical protein ACYTEZ_03230 [Planctomycetota bacterium]|jgi:hypothetical protein
MVRHVAFTLAVAAGLLEGQARAGEPSAEEAFAEMKELARRPDNPAFRALFVADAFERAPGARADEMRRALADVLVKGRLSRVREKGGEAVVVVRTQDDETAKGAREIRLRRESGRWLLAAGRSYVVAGARLKARQGRKPAKVHLTMRTTNGPYETSGYCFTYVTGDARLCKNRMDLWFCHNQDFHARGAGRVADLGKVPLAKVTGIPVGLAWERTIAARKGHAYVLHCRDGRDRDFFVKFRVTALRRGIAELEWTLLSEGFGAPATIHSAQPLQTRDGADGTDGLCGKHG